MRLDHIQLAIPPGGEDRAREFFADLLGMKEVEKPYPLSERGGVWFQLGGAIIHMGVEADFRPQKKAHPAFLMADLDELAQLLQKAGYDVIWDDALPNRQRFYSADPFGNRIEFMADGQGFSQI